MFIGIVFLGVCSYLGFYFARLVKADKNLLKGIINFNKSMIINLEYEKKSISEFVKDYKDKNVKEILDCYLKQLKKRNKINLNIKNKELKTQIEEYFFNLGKSNSQSQIEYTRSFDKIFLNQYEEFCQVSDKKIALYPKLGILTGGIVLIMLL